MTSPKIVIGIPTFNGSWRLGNLLKSIWLRTPELATGEACVVVVDDGSPNVSETRKVIEEWKGKIPLDFVEHGTNRGISAGWNTASRFHSCEHVVLVNDDVIAPSANLDGGVSWLQPMVYVLQHSPGVGVVGPNWHAFIGDDVAKLLESRDSDKEVIPRDPVSKNPTPSRRDLEPCDPGRVMAPGGQCFAFRRSDFDAIDGFDEGFKSFFEESSFGTSMAAGRKDAASPQVLKPMIGVGLNWAQVFHMWSQTFNENPQLEAHERMRVSRTYYYQKWAVPGSFSNPFDYTNPTHLGSCPDVEIKFLRGVTGEKWRAVLRQDGACIEQRKDD
jgi:glycosyltransferase involved in cell wall biosynthesis